MKQTLVAVLCVLVGASLTGCAVSALDKLKGLESSQQFTKIEAEAIPGDCAGSGRGSEECAQIEEIHARACLTLAQQESAPGAACPPATDSARRRLKCAADGFKEAAVGGHFSSEQRNEFTQMRAQALYCGATLGARADGLASVREASRELATLPPNPRRDLLAASAALYVANTDDVSGHERCDAAQRAVDLANRGLAGGAPGALQDGLTNTKRLALEVGGRLAGCRVH